MGYAPGLVGTDDYHAPETTVIELGTTSLCQASIGNLTESDGENWEY